MMSVCWKFVISLRNKTLEIEGRSRSCKITAKCFPQTEARKVKYLQEEKKRMQAEEFGLVWVRELSICSGRIWTKCICQSAVGKLKLLQNSNEACPPWIFWNRCKLKEIIFKIAAKFKQSMFMLNILKLLQTLRKAYSKFLQNSNRVYFEIAANLNKSIFMLNILRDLNCKSKFTGNHIQNCCKLEGNHIHGQYLEGFWFWNFLEEKLSVSEKTFKATICKKIIHG